MDSLFPSSYDSSRARFLLDVDRNRPRWPSSHLETHPLKNHPDLSIDWLWAEPRVKKNLVIISTAQHGIEGYVGSAMLKLFMDEFAPRLNPENTGLLLIHAVNPWGMKHGRKVNENNVDLNRNFVPNGVFDKSVNSDFPKLTNLLAPDHSARSFFVENLSFIGKFIHAYLTAGAEDISNAALLGQFASPQAMYYGGERYEEQTTLTMDLLREALTHYTTVLHLDQHSGYGPRYQMSITTVPQEPLTSAELSTKFNFPLIMRGDNTEFYAIHGDMCSWLYELREVEFPSKQVFACAFEFGTYGSSLLQRIHSLRTMIFESQLHWHGAQNERTAEKIRREFQELYFPAEEKWRAKAISDGRQAFAGILSAYALL